MVCRVKANVLRFWLKFQIFSLVIMGRNKGKDKGGKKKDSKGGVKNVQGMQFNHALGQHILKNPLIVQALIEKVNISIRKFSHSRI